MRAKSPSLLFAALAVPNSRPAIEIKGFRLIESKVEKRQVEMTATSAQVYKLENLMALNELEAKIWGQDKRPYHLDGRIGVLDSITQNFQIHSSSNVLSPDGYRFETQDVVYNSKARTLTTDARVLAEPRQRRGDSFLRITGSGLLIRLEDDAYFIPRDVIAFQQLSKESFFNIRSRNATILPSQSKAQFTGAVTVKAATMEMSGETLDIRFRSGSGAGGGDGPQGPESLELTGAKGGKGRVIKAKLPSLEVTSRGLKVRFDEAGAMESSEAVGAAQGKTADGVLLRAESLTTKQEGERNVVYLKQNVEIITGERVAACEDATFYMDTGEILLQRVASVKQGTQTLEGERIRLSTKNSEITVEQARGSMERREVFKK